MIQEAEISNFDLRYEDCRLKNPGVEKKLIVSILERGICEPLEGVDTKDGQILLNGFKRYRCAKKLGIGIVPYVSLGPDEAMGIIQLIRASGISSLSILEQASLIDELNKIHGMRVTEIAGHLSRSKAWVSVRMGIIGEMSEMIRQKIFTGAFPVYSYMYTLRQFIRINKIARNEVDEFVKAVSGKKLSIRDIEKLAYGYFMGPDEFREQVAKSNVDWVLKRLREQVGYDGDNCNETERAMLRSLENIHKYMQVIMTRSKDVKLRNNSFFAQSNLLAEGILSKIDVFSRKLRDFYDRSGQV